MNFETIKLGFLNWLEEKNEAEGKEIATNNPDMSIFLYNAEFKNYLIQEVGADSSIFSKSINEIMSMEIVNGKLVDKNEETGDIFTKENEDEYNGDSLIADSLNAIFENEDFAMYLDTDTNGEIGEDEINSFLTGIANPEDGQISFDSIAGAVQAMNDGTFTNKENELSETELLLKGVYSNEKAKTTLDINGDGELSAEEKTKFEEYIKNFDGNADDLTKEDIQTAFGQILNNEFAYEESNAEEQTLQEIPRQEETTLPAASSTPQSSGSTQTGGTGNAIGGGLTSTPSGNRLQLDNTNGLQSKSIDELEQVKSTRESDVSKARDNINAVYSGENEAVKTAQEDYEKAKDNYDKAVENDEKISDELKQQRSKNLEDIEKKQSEIDDVNTQINNKEAEISDAENTLSADESNLAALEAALSALPASSDDPETQAQIEAQRSALEAQIREIEQKITEDKNTIDQLNQESDELKEQLNTKQAELDELEETRSDIEKEISENCGEETKAALQAFNEAKENADSVKETELSSAKETLTQAKSALDEVNTVINNKKAEETKKEHKVSTSKFDGQEFLDELSTLSGPAVAEFDNLCEVFGKSREEMADYLTEMCMSEEWGNGCISPSLLIGQIYNESSYRPACVGDSGAAVGLSQFHKVAVDEVNRVFKTNYTYEDRTNPEKSIEMMVLLLKHCKKQTGTTDGMLAMYNRGHKTGINEIQGKHYVEHVYSQIGIEHILT